MDANGLGTFKVKAGKIVACRCLRPTDRVEGSKKYGSAVVDGECVIFEKSKPQTVVDAEPSEPVKKETKTKKKKEYKVNKKEVWSRCLAMCSLRIAKKFTTLMTVSFPRGMDDDSIFKCWNVFLTRLRKEYKLSMYVWVTERQKNGTLHYHAVIPQWLPVRDVNSMMATTIKNELRRRPQFGVVNVGDRYNGVDISTPNGNRRKIIAYITKYVMKQKETYSHLAWHCSHIVSNLFTTYDAPTWGEVESIFEGKLKVRQIYRSDFADVIFYDDDGTEIFLELMNAWNERVFAYETGEAPKVSEPELIETPAPIPTAGVWMQTEFDF